MSDSRLSNGDTIAVWGGGVSHAPWRRAGTRARNRPWPDPLEQLQNVHLRPGCDTLSGGVVIAHHLRFDAPAGRHIILREW